MKTFLGAPIRHGEERLGNIYLTEKEGSADYFMPEDESLLVLFAAQAAMAIRNAQLHRRVQDLVLLEERDRIGMDLHDGVIQSLYATGLRLEACVDEVQAHDPLTAKELTKAIDQLNQVIQDTRSYILRLQPGVLAEADLAAAVGGLLQEIKVNTLIEVELVEAPGACAELTDDETSTLFHIAQEAITNARKHADASNVRAQLERCDGSFVMSIRDNGTGFDPESSNTGNGLHNMRERIQKLGGTFQVTSVPESGTTVTVTLPAKTKAHD
jgi:signal transduction histidine kinase